MKGLLRILTSARNLSDKSSSGVVASDRRKGNWSSLRRLDRSLGGQATAGEALTAAAAPRAEFALLERIVGEPLLLPLQLLLLFLLLWLRLHWRKALTAE